MNPQLAYGQYPPQSWPQQQVAPQAGGPPPAPMPSLNGTQPNHQLSNQMQNMSLSGPPPPQQQQGPPKMGAPNVNGPALAAPLPSSNFTNQQPPMVRPPSAGGPAPAGYGPPSQQQPAPQGPHMMSNGPPGPPPAGGVRPPAPMAGGYGQTNGHQMGAPAQQFGGAVPPMAAPGGGPPRPGQPFPPQPAGFQQQPQPTGYPSAPGGGAPPQTQGGSYGGPLGGPAPPQPQQQFPGSGQPGQPMPPQQQQQPPQGYPVQPGQMPPMAGGQMPPRGYNQMPPGAGYNQMPPMAGQPHQQQPPQHQLHQHQQQGYHQGGPAGMMGGHYPAPPPVPQQKRLDPESMPNPIQVMAENQENCGGIFSTNQPGQLPPLVTTKFVTQDEGNTSPRFVRSTMYNIPQTADMMKQSAVPFALIISPFARTVEGELPIPIVDFGEMGPIRCIRCKAYICSTMQFLDGGRRFQCQFCKATTEVPPGYFQHLDHTGQRMDKYERPELVLGTYEFVATKEYCRNSTPPKPPAMVFLIDVSYNNVKSGLVQLLCAQMKNIIRHLPVDQNQQRTSMKVGFITYNSSVHFYNLKSSLAQPQMMVVGDLQEMFMPLLDGFLVDPEESATVIDALMEQIPKMFGDTRETETILLPALQAGVEALKASECVGKLYVFHSSLPNAEAPGKLKIRDDRKLLGTDKEKTVLTPQSTVYNMLAQECVLAGVSVDLFAFNNAYIDLASIGQVARLTGGEVYKYTYFQADIDSARLVNDLLKNISRPIAFDAVMRVRTSTGVRATDFYGHMFMSNTKDMEIASIDCDKSVSVEIKHDDKLTDELVLIQVALLYTSCSGVRRLRVHNLNLKMCTSLLDLFRCCDLDTTLLYFAKQGLTKLMDNNPKAVKDAIVHRAVQLLACYRKHCASPTSSGQLILPEGMKLLPLYVNCLLKNDAFSGGSDISIDDRSYVIYYVMSMDLPTSVHYFYPRLIPLHDVNVEGGDAVPAAIRCTGDKMLEDGAYILENGVHMFLWLGLSLSSEFTQSVFGAQCTQQIDTDRTGLPVFDNALSKRIRGIVDKIQEQKRRCMRLTLVKQRDKLESVLRHFLVEDRGTTDGSVSYVDFLCHVHKEIRQMLS
ncbi:protein transport protein Sec24D [Anopheles moucheti]|uniref:protein transport protein Sec24D n=1 Tax=Anopheles moucheti TaxID=186751 RepID=UPI0022F0B0E1|nr:protein transport protein Sec24D [Anopheles moucheti]XP_052892320.1 protein transport protein Sec24D [Anopheles moucheti]